MLLGLGLIGLRAQGLGFRAGLGGFVSLGWGFWSFRI